MFCARAIGCPGVNGRGRGGKIGQRRGEVGREWKKERERERERHSR